MQNGSEYELADTWNWRKSIRRWMLECFGEIIAADKKECSHRFIEEAIKLVQATGLPKEEVLMLVEYVYGHPVGEQFQEVGVVMITLEALCQAQGLDLDRAMNTERDRIFIKMDQIKRKQQNKPRNSPLPE